ncbi:MAG TPA: glutamine synthetase family protein [Caldimonas sp.]|nr:glutamine synthetase family protein [Caldimonas sp.]
MTTFAERCGAADAARAGACEAALALVEQRGLERVRIGWCDTHGVLRGKTLMASALEGALREGVTMVSTILLKDTSDRTAYRVFDDEDAHAVPGFRYANNLILLPDPHSIRELAWAAGTGWMRAEAWFGDGTPVPQDTRRILRTALDRLAHAGYGLVCGLEVEFHIYRIVDEANDPSLDPHRAAWPGEAPTVAMIHPGYNLLAENWADLADEPLAIVQQTAQELGLPLRSLEVELGPSQVEAVFDATDALTAADHMVLFRNGVRQALRRAGYHASFVCRPPFPSAMASGWHLHQSLVERASGRNAFVRTAVPANASAGDARATLSDVGAHWLGGLLAHGRGMAALSAPTVNAFARFRPNAMAPQSVIWGRDNRGAMLRVLGACGDAATRIENRIGEPMANPYLYVAAQVHAGLDGLQRKLDPGPEAGAPYAASGANLPASLGEGLDALATDEALVRGFSPAVVDWYVRVKRSEVARHDAAEDREAWQAREYFGRF